jgi:hypothetical protein
MMMIRQSTQVTKEFGAECACRGIANIACTRSIGTIRMMNKEEMGVVFMVEDSSVSKEAECRSRDAWKRKVALEGYGAESIKGKRT